MVLEIRNWGIPNQEIAENNDTVMLNAGS